MTKLNKETKDRISSAYEFIKGNNLNDLELQAELTGLVIFSIDNYRESLSIIDGNETNNYYRKQTENNYEK